MRPYISLIIFIPVIIGLYVWAVSIQRSVEENLGTEVTQAPIANRLALPTTGSSNRETSAQAATPPQTLQQEPTALPDVSQLSIELNEARRLLEDHRITLESLRREQSEQVASINQQYPTRITETSSQIQTLTSILADHRMAESEVNDAASNALQQQSAAERLARDQIENNIIQTQQEIRRTQDSLGALPDPLLTGEERTARRQAAENQLRTLQEQLEDLRLQRLNLSAGVLLGTQQIHQTAQADKAALVENQYAIREEIVSLQRDIRRLQSERAQLQRSTTSLTDRIRQTEQSIREQEQRIRDLEARLPVQRR